MIISFEDLKSVCSNAGMIREGRTWCAFKDRKPAKQWSDWQPCTKENCPFNQKKQHPEKYEQLSFDFGEGETGA